MGTRYLHTMIRVHDLEKTKGFLEEFLGLEETRRMDSEAGKFTLVFMSPPGEPDKPVELTYNWGS
ncbi:MAG: VOC family protein, partial [Pseudomonadota bacterium]